MRYVSMSSPRTSNFASSAAPFVDTHVDVHTYIQTHLCARTCLHVHTFSLPPSLSPPPPKGQVGLLEASDYILSHQDRTGKLSCPCCHNPESRISRAAPFRTRPLLPAAWGKGGAARSMPGSTSERCPVACSPASAISLRFSHLRALALA